MYNSLDFNPQAVLFYSPAEYAVTCEVAPGLEMGLNAALQANGNYYLYSDRNAKAEAAANDILVSNGLAKLNRRTQWSHQDAMKMLAALRARVSANGKHGPEYQDFLQAQIDNYTSTRPAPEFVKARDEFIHIGTVLLNELQSFFPDYTVRKLVNPVTSMALAKQRAGVFVWPDWRSDRYVNLVVGHVQADDPDLREAIYDWTDRVGVRINIGVHF